jgi:hypothetical protein
MKTMLTVVLSTSMLLSLPRCSDSKKNTPDATGKSYTFSTSGFGSLKLKSASLTDAEVSIGTALTPGPTLCSSVVCFTPTALTGKYYGTGFLIQSNGNGMVAYFGQDNWSSITGTSEKYSFDSAAPTTNPGSLFCCNGTGDLTSSNTYISDAIYLFAYLDATFTVSGVTSNTLMNREFTVRFILADDAIATAKRGDLLLKDPADNVFKWMDPSISAGGITGQGTLVATRPSSPVTMNTSVKDWTNPFGTDKGNQTIPVINAALIPASGEVYQVNENDLKVVGKTYTYSFDPTNFIMFPTFLTADKNSLYSYAQLLSNIHLASLPHSGQPLGVGSASSTTLTVTGP